MRCVDVCIVDHGWRELGFVIVVPPEASHVESSLVTDCKHPCRGEV